jgi:hypothetical protein
LACNPGALSAAENRERPRLFARLRAAATVESEDDTGLRWRVARSATMLADAARLIALESRCCGFLDFRLEAEAGSGTFALELRGPAGTHEILRLELERPAEG